MHDPASELPRIPIPRTPVNKGQYQYLYRKPATSKIVGRRRRFPRPVASVNGALREKMRKTSLRRAGRRKVILPLQSSAIQHLKGVFRCNFLLSENLSHLGMGRAASQERRAPGYYRS